MSEEVGVRRVGVLGPDAHLAASDRPRSRRVRGRDGPTRRRRPRCRGWSGDGVHELTVDSATVRLVVARCQVDYAGRLTAHLPMAHRVLMIKADGSVLVHSDGGSYKPLNWMSPPCSVREGVNDDDQVEWMVTGKDGDTLRILIEDIQHDSSHELGVDPGPAEGRRREAPPGAARRAPGHAGRRAHAGPPRVPDRDRPGRPDVPRRRRRLGGRRDQAPRRDRRRRAADPLSRAAQPRPAAARRARSGASSPPS